jgi:hypothetical protein
VTTAERPPILDRLHDAFVILLVALRPLCWDGSPGQLADMIWQSLAVGGLLLIAIERAALLRSSWSWSWRGVLALALLFALLPAVLSAPEPAPAWCFWTGFAACLAAAAYLAQVLPGRLSLVWASLGGGLLVTALFGVVQPYVVLPAMAAAQQAGASLFDALPGDSSAIAERIANGGAFATFTLANQFGAYLALTIPIMAGIAWVSRGGARWVACGLVLLGCTAMYCSGAKGACLALAAGGGMAWWLAWNGRWWRWLPLPLGAIALVALLMSGKAAASIDVRVGYWRSATALVAEAPLAGQGYGAFAAHQPRLMQPGDEPTRFVHNEVLEAAVSGGLTLALLLVVSLAVLAWPRRQVEDRFEANPPPSAMLWVIAVMIPYLALLHAFDGNLGWWPGGGGMLAVLGWAILLGVLGSGTAVLLQRAKVPQPWAIAAGLTAVGLKALIDFDLHAMGIVGTALLIAVAGGGKQRQTVGTVSRWLPLAAAVSAIVLVGSGLRTGFRLSDADAWIADARQVRDAQAAQLLAQRLEVDPATPPAVLAAQAGLRAWNLAEGAPVLRLSALDLLPSVPQTLEMAEELARSAPYSAAIAVRHATALTLAHEWEAAVEEAERAVLLAPTSPRTLLMVAEIMERAVAAQPLRISLRNRALELRAEAGRLQPLVHPSMRSKA